MISGRQIRAARALLGISAKDLANLSGLGWATIQRYEAKDELAAGQTEKVGALKSALEAQGVEFIGDPITSPGVRLRQS